jgi:hypothetical protein
LWAWLEGRTVSGWTSMIAVTLVLGSAQLMIWGCSANTSAACISRPRTARPGS